MTVSDRPTQRPQGPNAVPGRVLQKSVAYPYLAAAFSVFAMAAHNSGEIIRGSDISLPLITVLFVTALGHVLGSLIIRNRHGAGLFALLTLVLFTTYGYIAGGFYLTVGHELAIRWEPVLALVLAASLVAVAFLLRASRPVALRVTHVLNLFFGFLLAYNAGVFCWALLRPAAPHVVTRLPPVGDLQRTPRPPDIYLIVPDKYTGSDALAKHLQFDNKEMVAALTQRGFVVPRAARANYAHTFLALAAMLNLRYLDDFPARFGKRNTRWRDAYPTIEHNETVRLLRAHGYRFVFLPTAFGATRQNEEADIQLPAPSEIKPEFVIAWRRTTLLPFLHRAICDLGSCTVGYFPYVPEAAALTDWKFQQLERLGLPERPTFVLAHLTVPHEPYMYGPNCEHVKPYWPPHDHGEYGPKVRRAYVAQIRCVNRKLLELVDAIRANATVPPVILIQSDHGHGRVGRWVPPLDQATEEQITERLSVFAAYLIPNLAEGVPDTITPVNAMRLALRTAIGANLPPLPDMSYWSSREHAFDLSRVR